MTDEPQKEAQRFCLDHNGFSGLTRMCPTCSAVLVGLPSVPQQEQWTCFHCGETFTTPGSARDHFGATPENVAGCLIDRVALEEGGKPERGRGLLMALRKAEQRESGIVALIQQLKALHDAAKSYVDLSRVQGISLREEAATNVRNELAKSRQLLESDDLASLLGSGQ